MVFHAGIYVTPLIGGWVMDAFSPPVYLGFLIALALAAAGGTVKIREG